MQYRTTTAFFPAEALVQLYEVLGGVGLLTRFLMFDSQALVAVALSDGRQSECKVSKNCERSSDCDEMPSLA